MTNVDIIIEEFVRSKYALPISSEDLEEVYYLCQIYKNKFGKDEKFTNFIITKI